jgi:predicted Zn-dependent peptidase
MGRFMQINRRDTLKAFFGGAAATSLPLALSFPAQAFPIKQAGGHQTFTLDNGLRTHFIANNSGYVTATLVLRSKEITHNGLAHLCEHTSCAGAAGNMSAAQVTALFKDCVQDSNATTEAGALRWFASFLPQYLPQVTDLLSAISLDQKFDLETVAAQQRVVREELYLDKYNPSLAAEQKFDRELFGKSHPYAKETLEEEIARCKIAPEKCAAELAAFADRTRLPGNMDLFVVGSIEPNALQDLVQKSFGRFARTEGPRLDIPRVDVTRAYKPLTEPSFELQRPMSELRIAWNTGVCNTGADARTLLALGSYLGTALFDELREKDGDTYTPDVSYEPDACSGVFRVAISSSKDPQKVEKKVFEVVDKMKSAIDAKELARLRDRIALKRCKEAGDNQALLDRLVDRTLEGCGVGDLAVDTVTPEEMMAAACKYMPSHREGYVRLALKGQ